MAASVVVVTYRRLERLNEILAEWCRQSDDVWLADCSGGKFSTELPIHHVRFNDDPGNRTRHAIALLTKHPYVIKADDDVLPKPGFAKHLVTWQKRLGGIVGVHGRRFFGEDYYKNTRCYSAKRVKKPVAADFVGIVTCMQRGVLAFDLKGCHTGIEEIFWQMGIWPGLPKHIIPTQAWDSLGTASDDACLFMDSETRKQRTEFCRRWYRSTHGRRDIHSKALDTA